MGKGLWAADHCFGQGKSRSETTYPSQGQGRNHRIVCFISLGALGEPTRAQCAVMGVEIICAAVNNVSILSNHGSMKPKVLTGREGAKMMQRKCGGKKEHVGVD